MISPFDTGPFLTRRPPGAAGATFDQLYAVRPRNFVRTVGADHIQVAAAAALARRLGAHRVAVLYDRQGMLEEMQERWFAYAARRVGIVAVPVYVDPQRRTFVPALARAHADAAFLVSYALGISPAQGRPVVAALDRFFATKPVIVTDAFPPAAAHGGRARYYMLGAGVGRAALLAPDDRWILDELPASERIPSAVAQTAAATRDLLAAIAASDGSRRSIVAHLRATPGLDRAGDPRTAPFTVTTLNPPAYATTITPPLAAVPPR
jgi:hypothetical protein